MVTYADEEIHLLYTVQYTTSKKQVWVLDRVKTTQQRDGERKGGERKGGERKGGESERKKK